MRTFRIYVTFCLVLLLCFIALMPSVHASDASESDVLSSYGIDASSQFMGGEPNYHDDYLESYYNRYLIPIVVAADEKFQANSYWVPWNVNGLGWKEAILNIVERADNDIYEKYGVNFRVIEFVTWQSNDSLHDRAKRLHELADDLNWNPSVHGKIILAGFTGQKMINENDGIEVIGCAFDQTKNQTKALLMRTEAYWADDNVFHHELSHLLGLDECFGKKCVMGNTKEFVTYVYEGNWVWFIGAEVQWVFLTHSYCPSCESTFLLGLKPYENPIAGRMGGVGGGRNFAI